MKKKIEILLVEDNPGDVNLILECFKQAKILNRIHLASDGEQALSFLYRHEGFEDVPSPDLIILDLNLPRKDGLEVLREIKADPNLRRTPVVILTTSQDDRDILKSYDLHANCYLIKPLDLRKFIEVVASIEKFWLVAVKLPAHAIAR